MKKIVSIILTAIVLICINGTVNASDVVTVPVNNPHPQENFELDMNGSTGYGVIDLVIRNAAGKKIGTAPAGHSFNFGRDCGQALGLWTNWPPDTSCLAIRDNLHPVRIEKYAGSQTNNRGGVMVRYCIVCKEEIAALEQTEGIKAKSPEEYMRCSKKGLAQLCSLKDRSNDLFFKRAEAARAVIDMIAKRIGIDPQDTSYWLYSPDADGSSPVLAKIDDYFSRSGDKVKLKKRIDELERENSVLRSLLTK